MANVLMPYTQPSGSVLSTKLEEVDTVSGRCSGNHSGRGQQMLEGPGAARSGGRTPAKRSELGEKAERTIVFRVTPLGGTAAFLETHSRRVILQ